MLLAMLLAPLERLNLGTGTGLSEYEYGDHILVLLIFPYLRVPSIGRSPFRLNFVRSR